MLQLKTPRSASAAALARAAIGAHAAGAGANDFIAAADRTGDAHEDAAQGDRYAIGVRVAVAVAHGRPAVAGIGRMTRDHVDHLFLASPRQIGNRSIQNLLLDVENFFER